MALKIKAVVNAVAINVRKNQNVINKEKRLGTTERTPKNKTPKKANFCGLMC